MQHILSYLNALRHHWGALVSGGALIGALSIWQGTGHAVPVWIYWTIPLVGILVASFLAWQDQYVAREGQSKKVIELEQRIYDGRPIFILRVSRNNTPGEWTFRLENCGARPARWVRMDSIISYKGNFRLIFGTIPVLYVAGNEVVGHEVNSLGSFQKKRPLSEFLNDYEHRDGLDRMALGWWDINVKFRDTDEHVGEELVRLCCDVQDDVLYGIDVPYTERPATQIEITREPNSKTTLPKGE